MFQVQGILMLMISLLLFGLQAWTFLDALTRRPDHFVAADKLTKPAWLIILGLALVAHMIFWEPLQFLNLVGAVAAIVYMVDVRPALRAVTGR
jgi:Protein of unknown function (DUF2516)